MHRINMPVVTAGILALVVATLLSSDISGSEDRKSQSGSQVTSDQSAKLPMDGPKLLHGVPRGPLGSDVSILVDPGFPDGAKAYYRRIESDDELGVNLIGSAGELESTLDDLLVYLGYRDPQSTDNGEGITADRIERFDSDVLIDIDKMKAAVAADGGNAATVKTFAPNDIIASRFFAPKITDVTREAPFHKYGWRKLVRFKPLSGSTAQGKGVLSAFLLFNVFATEQALQAGSPFRFRSNNNQVILTRNPASPATLDDPLYWLVFGELPEGKIGLALNASFDARDPATVPVDAAYYVPRACADCHGGLDEDTGEPDFPRAKLNYLDTDHWFDRVLGIPEIGFEDDFFAIQGTPHGILFDGGQDQTTPEFATAFSRIEALNKEILAQNQDVDPTESSFQIRAAKRWIELHSGGNVQHAGLLDDADNDGFLDRAIEGDAGQAGASDRWRKNDRIDEALLPMLNRYCFRCHSSLKYSVYDRSRVRFLSSENNGVMQFYLTQPVPPAFVPFMPQDRPMPPADRKRIVDLVNKLIDVQ